MESVPRWRNGLRRCRTAISRKYPKNIIALPHDLLLRQRDCDQDPQRAGDDRHRLPAGECGADSGKSFAPGTESPIHTVIYTHGHVDHTGGISIIDAEADGLNRKRPRIVAHRNVAHAVCSAIRTPTAS